MITRKGIKNLLNAPIVVGDKTPTSTMAFKWFSAYHTIRKTKFREKPNTFSRVLYRLPKNSEFAYNGIQAHLYDTVWLQGEIGNCIGWVKANDIKEEAWLLTDGSSK